MKSGKLRRSRLISNSGRFMWREGGKGEIYAYIPPQLQPKALCNENGNVCNSSYGYSLGRGSWTFKTNAWNSVRQVVKLNTVGKQDGQLTVFINGKQVYQQSNLVYRTKATAKTFGIGKWLNWNCTQLTLLLVSPDRFPNLLWRIIVGVSNSENPTLFLQRVPLECALIQEL